MEALAELRRSSSPATFPRFALRDASSALVLFAAAFRGTNDAVFVEEAGLVATCVDVDGRGLEEMRRIYPDDWEFVTADAFEWIPNTVARGERWDVVTADPFTGSAMIRTLEMLEAICELSRDVVIVGITDDLELENPPGWEIVDVVERNASRRTSWAVLQRLGVGVDPADVTACLVTRGDQTEHLERIVDELPFGEIIVWNNAEREHDLRTAGRYAAMMEASNRVVYFQDDDTIFRYPRSLCRFYEPGQITATYGHGENPAGYGDLPLVCGGGLADRVAVLDALCDYRAGPIRLETWTPEELAYADFAVGILTPFRHVHLPFEIVLSIAQGSERLVNQPWAAAAKAGVTARARAIRDST